MVPRKFKSLKAAILRKVKNIVLGWWTLLSGSTPEWAKDRLWICRSCPKNKFWICTECGCPLAAKTRSEDEECPLKKWTSRPVKVIQDKW